MTELRGLYPLVDLDALAACRIPVLGFADAVLAARPPLLQLRAKSQGARVVLELLRALAPRCRAAGTLLFANDRPDLAVLGGADGVHVGQEDLSVAEVRRFAPSLRIGTSTHNLRELGQALAERPAYVAYGPIFGTRSKAKPDPTVGVEGLRQASELARAAVCPLVAIGGIDLERAVTVVSHAPLAAVIAELVDAGPEPASITRRALELHHILSR
ncbi:MAG: thiamine phosphate synthase [Polyangiaceae bacterium]|nr:thiamine phosphate synthase [Polyangiaceae bacterium]